MHPHTPRTRSRSERLAARAEDGPGVVALSVGALLVLFYPAAAVTALPLLAVRRFVPPADGEAPTGHGRVRSWPPSPS